MKNNIVACIDAWAKEKDKICYRDEQVSYTYKELKEQSDRVAGYLQQISETSKPIIVFGGLDYEMLVCFLGCVKSGHAYIPIDAHMPVPRMNMILKTVEPEVILANAPWPIESDILVDGIHPKIFNKEMIDQMIENESSKKEGSSLVTGKESYDPAKMVSCDDNFYIIFTSGTTGTPKGVQISHDNLKSFVDWMLEDFDLPRGAAFLSQAPYSFDLSVMDVYPALVSGGILVPLRKEVIDDFKKLFTVLGAIDVNVWVSTPSFMNICLMDEHFTMANHPKLKHFLFCGEELTVTTAKKLKERFPDAKVYNTYGPTEATVAMTQILITDEILNKYGRLPIGYVKNDTQMYVMDDEGKEVPNGESGELVIVGPGVSKGYYHSPEKTQQSFLTIKGQQGYKTGDLGVKENGLYFCKGRTDFQIKLHGYRIELEDIDQNLGKVSYVKEAVVVPKMKDHKVEQLVAFVVAKQHDFTKEFQLSKAIKQELKEYVMDYMIPQKYVYIDRLPLTSNGKVDRKTLMKEVNI